MNKITIAAVLFSGTVNAATVELSWINPTETVNGDTIPAAGDSALATTIIQWGTCADSNKFDKRLGVKRFSQPATSGIIEDLSEGVPYCFRAFAQNNAGERSGQSNTISITTEKNVVEPSSKPKSPTGLTVRQLSEVVNNE